MFTCEGSGFRVQVQLVCLVKQGSVKILLETWQSPSAYAPKSKIMYVLVLETSKQKSLFRV